MADQGMIQTLIVAFKDGGIVMVLIAITFFVSVAMILERLVSLYSRLSVNGNSFMFEIQKHIVANDLDGAIRTCNGAGQAALPRVIKAGLQRASRDDQQIQNAIDAASLEVMPKLERNLPYLAMIANISTLLGLLGTIFGLIRAFAALEQADPAQRQAVLSHGISEAMYATGFGLLTAILTMVFHTILSTRANRLLEEIDEFGVKLLDLLSARKYKHTSEKGE